MIWPKGLGALSERTCRSELGPPERIEVGQSILSMALQATVIRSRLGSRNIWSKIVEVNVLLEMVLNRFVPAFRMTFKYKARGEQLGNAYTIACASSRVV